MLCLSDQNVGSHQITKAEVKWQVFPSMLSEHLSLLDQSLVVTVPADVFEDQKRTNLPDVLTHSLFV